MKVGVMRLLSILQGPRLFTLFVFHGIYKITKIFSSEKKPFGVFRFHSISVKKNKTKSFVFP